MLQYKRKVRLAFNGGALRINHDQDTDRQLRIVFSVSKDISSVANDAWVDIYNLSEGHRNAVGKEYENLTLEAGYMPDTGQNNVGIIFKGQLRDAKHRREGPDIITRVTCGDGDRALVKAVKSKTWPAGTKVQTIVEDLYAEFEKQGIARGEWKGLEDLPPYKRPYSMCGTCEGEMDHLGRSNSFYWSIQNEALEIIPGDGFIEAAVYLSPQTGLIGTPTITDNGVHFDALLNPEIRPNRTVVIESETLEMNSEGGKYRVSQAVYSGDNRGSGNDFLVSGTGEKIEGDKVDEGRLGTPQAPIPDGVGN